MVKGLIFQQQQQQQVMEENLSNLTSASGEASVSSGNRTEIGTSYLAPSSTQSQPLKKKRNLPGNPDPDAEVIAMSPKSLLAKNRFICEICNKGFQRDQNLQLHRRGHNLPWKLKQRTSKEIKKKVYVCPEPSCVHHDPSRALGDLTGIKKHFCRKHGEKKWKCEKCSKKYAVQSDWKAHSKTCGTREYKCDCGTLFSRRDSFITHRAFCDALAEESARAMTNTGNPILPSLPLPSPQQQQQPSSSSHHHHHHMINLQSQFNNPQQQNLLFLNNNNAFAFKKEQQQQQQQQSFNLSSEMLPSWLGPQIVDNHQQQQHHHYQFSQEENPNPSQGSTLLPSPSQYQTASASPHMSATALLQKAAQMGATINRTPSTSTPTMTSSRSHQQHTHVSSSREDHNINTLNVPQYLIHDDVINSFNTTTTTTSNPSGFEGTPFEDSFASILNSKKDKNLTINDEGGGGGGGNEGLTRDFLGLRPLSQSDILSFAGIGNSSSNSSCLNDQQLQNQSQKPWQG